MQIQELDIFIDKEGKVNIEVRGVKGPSCLDITKAIEEALGGQIENREYKPDFYEEAEIGISEQQKQGF
jgi:Protein of unknown function (DUF2997)